MRNKEPEIISEDELRNLIYCGKFLGIFESLREIENLQLMKELLERLKHVYNNVKDKSIEKISLEDYFRNYTTLNNFKGFYEFAIKSIEKRNINKLKKIISKIDNKISNDDLQGGCFTAHIHHYYNYSKEEAIKKAIEELNED